MAVLSKVWNAFVLSKKDKCLRIRNYPLILERICSDKKYFQMTDRKLKVYNSYRSKDKQAVPEVRLIGQWLEQSGFKIGEQVQVTIKSQEITIKPIADGNH
ncbi:MAG: SymE family type I addiction module toxin [Nostochopsis sp.]